MNEQQNNNTNEQQVLPFDPPLEENQAITALTAENEQLKNVLRLRDARDLITKDLAAAGARSPTLLFESVADKLQFDDSGVLQNAAAVVGMLRREYPEQFEAADPMSIDAGAGIGQRGRPLTREALAGMSASQIARLDWADVRQVLSE